MYNIRVTASTNGGEGEGARATEITKFGGSQRPINHLTHVLLHALPLCVILALWLGAVKWGPHLDTSVLSAVYPPEIVSVNPTSEQDMYRMAIDSFHTTFGPLRYEVKY